MIGLSRLLDTHIAYEIGIEKITTGKWVDAENDLSCWTVVKRCLDGGIRYMDGRCECEENRNSREILDIYSYIYILSFKLTYIPTL